MSVLFITHDMGVVAEVADRVLVMWRGRTVEIGETVSVFAAPTQAYTRALLSAVPRLGAMRGKPAPERFPLIDVATGLATPQPPIPRRDAAARPLLEVSGLTTRFDIRGGLLRRVTGRVHAVENVGFSLAAGETLALVGESGCGKSTTARSILRLVEPTAGEVLFDGANVRKLSGERLRALRRGMQMVFQDPFASLDPKQTVGNAITEPMLVHGLAERAGVGHEVADLLRMVGLTPDMAQRYPHEFSGGQRQRLAIARALSLRPKLIVADEAVSALDVSIKVQILNLLLELQEKLNLAVLFISHDMAVVERVSHRVAVMRLGEIVEIGPRAGVIDDARHPYTRRLMAAVPLPDPARRRGRLMLASEEISSPVRPVGYVPPRRGYREVAPGHLVQEF
jgi:peptide/nickel transport system ATP-binding protein